MIILYYIIIGMRKGFMAIDLNVLSANSHPLADWKRILNSRLIGHSVKFVK